MARELHALYAICYDRHGVKSGESVTFRVGLPVDWTTAQNRWERYDSQRRAGRAIRIMWMRRRYTVRWLEVRTVDRNGRGLGSERHGNAFTVPCRMARWGK